MAHRLVLEAGRQEAVLVVLGRKIEIDRHRLEQLEVAVDQRRHLAVRIDLEIVGRLEVLHLERDMLERNVEFMHDPERTCGARSGGTVNLNRHCVCSPKGVGRTIMQPAGVV